MNTLSYDKRGRIGRFLLDASNFINQPGSTFAEHIPPFRGGHSFMAGSKFSIRQVMILIGLVAVSLAIVRAVPLEFLRYPTIWILVGTLDFVIARKLILDRPINAFHYTAIVVVIVAFGVLANLAATGSIHPLGLLLRWYQLLSGERFNSVSLVGFLRVGEIWAAALLSLLLACSAGWAALRLERHLGWDIAAFWRGAFVGLLIAGLLATIYDVTHPEPGSVHIVPRLIVIGAFVISGGVMGLKWLRSTKAR